MIDYFAILKPDSDEIDAFFMAGSHSVDHPGL